MDIEKRMKAAKGLTPTEQQLVQTVLAMGERIQGCSIKELARAASASIASIHRLCKKLGLEGYKELKVELARSAAAHRARPESVDINFPFMANEHAEVIAPRMELLYETTLRETREALDNEALNHAAQLIVQASCVDIYTQSHNLYPAHMFCDRLLSAGIQATCYEGIENQVRTALTSDDTRVALAISYSGNAVNLSPLLPILVEHHTPVILVGTVHAAARHPGLSTYLTLSDHENMQNRITQFASHLAVQFVLDTLFSCVFALNYDEHYDFLSRSIPYTKLPGVCVNG